ncbi:uncharacterized protein LOC121860695 isoform X2 [Homarus americanus]|uniref:uncharacterized protein LOC121860695 isoform X2 n=1 Tax=Homarus americanus TaxID=6706 RepID=UPI001C45AFC7|nr:uncharacterized protein LOC121860695 isoform X2 [Homarus americanus]
MALVNTSVDGLVGSAAILDEMEQSGGDYNPLTSDPPTMGDNSTYKDYGIAVVSTLSFFLVVSMVLALGGNVMVIITIVRHRGMRTRTNLLLANLAVADILVAVLDMPIALVTIINGNWVFDDVFCYFNGFAVGLGLMLSVHTLMWISIHKFISITRPFSRSVTPGKIVMMIVAAWTWTILFNLTPTPLIGWTKSVYKKGASQCGPPPPKAKMQFVHAGLNTSVNLVIPIIVMSYCYYRIFKEVRDHLSRMRDFADASMRCSLIQQKRITETLCIVMSMFVLFWMPYIVYSLSLVFLGQENVLEVFNPIGYLFGYMNSACNPIIYALRSPSFRRGFSEIICRNQGGTPAITDRSQYDRVPVSNQYGRMIVSFRQSLGRTGNKSKRRVCSAKNKECRQLSSTNQQKTAVGDLAAVETEGQANYTADLPMSPQKNIYRCYDKNEGKQPVTNCSSGNVILTEYKESSTASEEMHHDPFAFSNNDVSIKYDSGNIYPNHDNSDIKDCEMSSVNEQNVPEVSVPLTSNDSFDNLVSDISDVSCSKQSHVSVIIPDHQRVVEAHVPSSSQSDITGLQWPSLRAQFPDKCVTRSHREIIFTTTNIITKHIIKSASMGDVRTTQPFSQLEKSPCSPQIKPPQHPKGKQRPWLLEWQPSVDNLYGSPILSRRKIFHMRKAEENSKSGEPSEQDKESEGHRKKHSTSSTGSSKHLGVTALINNFKRSLSDLFNLEENANVQNDPTSDTSDTAEDNEGSKFYV